MSSPQSYTTSNSSDANLELIRKPISNSLNHVVPSGHSANMSRVAGFAQLCIYTQLLRSIRNIQRLVHANSCLLTLKSATKGPSRNNFHESHKTIGGDLKCRSLYRQSQLRKVNKNLRLSNSSFFLFFNRLNKAEHERR